MPKMAASAGSKPSASCRVEEPARKDDAQLHELMCRDERRPKKRAITQAGDDAAHPDRASPNPIGAELRRTRQAHRRRQPVDTGRPLVSPRSEERRVGKE